MASKPISLKVESRGKHSLRNNSGYNVFSRSLQLGKRIPKLPTETSTYLQGSGSDLYKRVASQAGFSLHRLRITKGEDGKPIPNDTRVSIDSIGLRDGSVIQIKDLGMPYPSNPEL